MFYLMLAVFMLVVFNALLMFKLMYLVNEIKKYQYINNLKLLGFIKKTVDSLKFKVERGKYDSKG